VSNTLAKTVHESTKIRDGTKAGSAVFMLRFRAVTDDIQGGFDAAAGLFFSALIHLFGAGILTRRKVSQRPDNILYE
jgi:hypothetical protein